jgi:hypothetical protein
VNACHAITKLPLDVNVRTVYAPAVVEVPPETLNPEALAVR